MKVGDWVKFENFWRGKIGRVIKMGNFPNYWLVRWLDGHETWEEIDYIEVINESRRSSNESV